MFVFDLFGIDQPSKYCSPRVNYQKSDVFYNVNPGYSVIDLFGKE